MAKLDQQFLVWRKLRGIRSVADAAALMPALPPPGYKLNTPPVPPPKPK